ncbi:hypothetical protein UlMin_024012 [Ulmus minor]
MAGWDKEALLIATLIVDNTLDLKHKKCTELPFKTPQRSSRRKRRSYRSPLSIPICVLELDGKETVKDEKVSPKQKSEASCSRTSLPCLDKLREEFSLRRKILIIDICLDICFEPSGHSFCKKCLQSAIDKCGKKCPKSRLNRRSFFIMNTILWNTIQLLFSKEVEARKAAALEHNPRHINCCCLLSIFD